MDLNQQIIYDFAVRLIFLEAAHTDAAPGDIIQVSGDFYVVHEVGARKIQINE